jgi:hypothetical protein
MRCRASRAGPETSGPAGAVAMVRATQRVRGGPSCTVPARQPRATAGSVGTAPYRGTDRQALWTPNSGGEVPDEPLEAGGDLKGQSTGGRAEQASNTARGTPDATGAS